MNGPVWSIKKAEEQESREWYLRLARDHFAYIDIFHKTIDEIEECKKQNLLMVIDSKVKNSIKVQCLKELHCLSKTYTLVVKDLPFVTLLTKYYDRNLLFSNYNGSADAQRTCLNNNNQEYDKIPIVNKQHNKLEYKYIREVNPSIDNDGNTEVDKSIPHVEKRSNQYKDLDEEIMEEKQRQGHMTDFLKGKKYEEITEED